MIAPQGGPTYYNRPLPIPRQPPAMIVPGLSSASGGVTRPNPLAGWLQSIGQPTPIQWPNPGEIPPGSKDPQITPPFGATPSWDKNTQPTFGTPPGGTPQIGVSTPSGTSQTPPGITPPFQWPPAGQTPQTTDTVPAWLTPGEGVLNQGAAQMFGRNNIDRLNRAGQAVTGYQMGGQVPPFVQNRVQNAMQNHPWMQRYNPMQVAQHWQQRRQSGPMGFEGGIGYVPQSSIDPVQQNVQLSAPPVDFTALKAIAARNGINPMTIQSLIQAAVQAYKKRSTPGTGDGTSYGSFAGQSAAAVPIGYADGTSNVKKKITARLG